MTIIIVLRLNRRTLCSTGVMVAFQPSKLVVRVQVPCVAPKYVRLAQLGEHLPYKQEAAGSSPAANTICGISSAVERRLAKAEATGSSPVYHSSNAG